MVKPKALNVLHNTKKKKNVISTKVMCSMVLELWVPVPTHLYSDCLTHWKIPGVV
jgi:hypothetical protein